MSKRQLFIIPADTWESLSEPEVNATADAMRELGIFKLPYPEIDVWLPSNHTFGWNWESLSHSYNGDVSKLEQNIRNGLYEREGDQFRPVVGAGFVFEFRNLSLAHTDYTIAMHVEPGSRASKYYRTNTTAAVPNKPEHCVHARDQITKALIVLLATRNAVKSTRRDKMAALGIGKKHCHEYITTISLPRESATITSDDNIPMTPGKPRAPHLRRGHIRRQRHGPHFSLTRAIWIEPVFVNADKDWVDTRVRYNVSL
jgi:hypothetical protein